MGWWIYEYVKCYLFGGSMSEWISVEDRLPKIGQRVLTVYHGVIQNELWFLGGDLDHLFWYDTTDEETEPAELNAFSHWMLPLEPPEEA
jgi:hypothetical protein